MQNTNNGLSQKDILKQKYASSRNNLLLMLVLTVVNIILFVCGSYTMLLFSATIPYYLVVFGMFSDSIGLTICVTLAAVTLILYLLCWIFSKKHYGWMIGALVLFAIDTAAMAIMYIGVGEVSGILDAVIHILVLYYLITGVSNGAKLTKTKDDDIFTAETVNEEDTTKKDSL